MIEIKCLLFFNSLFPVAENLPSGSRQLPLFHRYQKAIVLGLSPPPPHEKEKQPLNNNLSKLWANFLNVSARLNLLAKVFSPINS